MTRLAFLVILLLITGCSASRSAAQQDTPVVTDGSGRRAEVPNLGAGSPEWVGTSGAGRGDLPAGPVLGAMVRLQAGQAETGVASWYDDGPGYYAAAPWYRWGMDPVPVTVCRIDHGRADCIAVLVSDHCQCYVGEKRERIIDLGPDAFRELAPLSVGLIRVRVERGAPPTLPPTDGEP